MCNREQMAMALKILVSAYPTHKATQETLAVYSVALMDICYDELQRAILWVVTHSRFFPTVAEIREAVGASAPDSERIPDADEAWGLVMSEMHRVRGVYGKPEFESPVVAAVVKQIGWHELCMSTQPGVIRGQFLKIYAIARKRAADRAQALPDDHPAMAMMTMLAGKMKMIESK